MRHLQTVVTVLTFEGTEDRRVRSGGTYHGSCVPNEERCHQRFPLCTHFAFNKTRHYQQYISTSTSQSFQHLLFWEDVQMNCAVPLSGGDGLQYTGQFHFDLTFTSVKSSLALLKPQPIPPHIHSCVFFWQPSFQPLHIKYCLPFNCWWSLPAVVCLCSQSIIDRYPRQGYLNSLRLAWFTFLRHG